MATLKLSTNKLGKEKLFNPPKSYKWIDPDCAIFKSILNLPETKNRSQSYRKFLAGTIVERKLKTSLKLKRGKGKKKVNSWYNETYLE